MRAWTWIGLPEGIKFPELVLILDRRMRDLASVLRGIPVTVWRSGETNPSVSDQAKIYKTANAGATNLAGFVDGFPGQTLILVAGDANTTLIHSANLILKGGVNVLLAAGNAKQFLTEDGAIWREFPAP